MYLSKFTDYGLRVLVFLAIHPDRKMTIAQIGEHFNMPRNHVMKVVQSLSAAGFVATQPGKKGGVQLPPQGLTIRVGDVVRKLERNLEIIDCDAPLCPISGACNLKSALDEARDAFLAALDRHSLADMVSNGDILRRRIGLDPAA